MEKPMSSASWEIHRSQAQGPWSPGSFGLSLKPSWEVLGQASQTLPPPPLTWPLSLGHDTMTKGGPKRRQVRAGYCEKPLTTVVGAWEVVGTRRREE